MTQLSEFEQRLSQIKQGETDAVENERRRKETEILDAQKAAIKWTEEKPLRLRKLGQDAAVFRSLLESVNTCYLGGQAQMNQSIDIEAGNDLIITLEWDKRKYSGNRISLRRNWENDLKLGFENWWDYEFDTSEENYLEKVQEKIIEGIKNKEYHWFSPPYEPVDGGN